MVPYFISEWILMVLFTGLTVSGSPVRGVVGQNVTLPCKYRVNRPSDITTMCWGRGSCPSFQCSQPILWTDGWRVTKRQSSRYQLEGNLTRGDVSLTIVNVAEADGGVYCCRVEIPGWFNDQQKNLEVAIETAAANASDTPSTVAPQWPLVFSSEAPQDASILSLILQPRTRRLPEHAGSWGPCRREYLYDGLKNGWIRSLINTVALASYYKTSPVYTTLQTICSTDHF
ncbi:hepatitis A virus cellular receptor 1 homolog isoform X9 [Chelonia mydas]|uniref:hepatitis A virus cellular receptor 1 homolog isoform X9 n=1 Tax=Chelonia mydas TaxID=8469 RepID=UPI001CA951E5|nr:hepatitis A virus cellular receptor 1 homolog isoform X9 [Chelonia mydas]